jgi:hypothetical protein
VLASVVYHSAYLRQTLPPTHLLFATALFRTANLIPTLRELIECRLPRPNDRIRATGLSPTTVVLQQLESVQEQVKVLAEVVQKVSPQVSEAVVKVLEERSIQANVVTHTGLQTALEDLLRRLQSPPPPPPVPAKESYKALLSITL